VSPVEHFYYDTSADEIDRKPRRKSATNVAAQTSPDFYCDKNADEIDGKLAKKICLDSNVAAQTSPGSTTCSSCAHLWQQLLLLLDGGLGGSDAVDDEPNTALGDDVRGAVSHLDVHHRLSP